MCRICVVFFLLFLSGFFYAQNLVLKPIQLVNQAKKDGVNYREVNLFKLADSRNVPDLPVELVHYSLLNLDKAQVEALQNSNSGFITLTIPQSGRKSLALELVEVNPFADDFKLTLAPSMQVAQVEQGKHYRGIIKDMENSVACISVFDNEVMGMVSDPSMEGNLVIGKLENSSAYIIYEDNQIADKFNHECHTADDNQSYTPEELRGSHTGERSLTDCVRLYLEVDYDVFTNKSSNLTTTNNYITGLFNQVMTLYANEQIKTVISEIVVWNQQSPYSASTSDGLLNAFMTYRKSFSGDLGMLLSGKSNGGIAYINGLCRSNQAFSMGYSGIHFTYQNVPVYSWSVNVCAHEFGHLFGSVHTHACAWNGNNTPLDGCYPAEGSCANGPMPSAGGGTIMSYCHLNSSVGINFSNGFGAQPGNVIRSRVTSASCLQACTGTGGGGGTTCDKITLTLEMRTDAYPDETTWELKNSSGQVLYSGGPYQAINALNTNSFCVPAGCYSFIIKDAYGDGICCGNGNGSYTIKQGTTVLATGGQFGFSETKSICTSNSVPTCSDGIKNGNETGIDCGGSCTPCATCSDGIKNGNETGIDCGGSCTPCATCSDGIKNGNETGIDCGGSCTPCATCSDGIKNGNETGIDCGGSCTPCATCSDGIKNGNETGIDCGGSCTPCATCSDGIKNGNETGIDCGGSCTPCATCSDGIKNGNETGIDCGGSCTPCTTCSDGIKNGTETGIDCGGSCVPCSTACTNIVVEIKTDQYPSEITWNIKNASGVIVASGGNYPTANAVNTHTFCLPTACYTFNIADGYGDGILAPGYFKVTQGTVVLVSNSAYTLSKSVSFCIGNTTVATCSDGIKNGTETGVDCGGSCTPCSTCSDGIKNGNETGIDCGGSCTPCATCSDGIKNGTETGIDCGGSCVPCSTACTNIVVEIKTDQYPSEITWNIKNASGVIVASGGNYPTANAVNTHTYCLPTACYTFNITDGYGDGILAPGYFKVSQGTVVLVSNSAYTLSKSVSFCIGNTTVATCSDGIKNGTETGVDCGGSCTPCSTCSDGIKNGNETGIDCGGSCTPCATCGDGIKNGTETGVDCGGTCTPCNTSITVLSGHYFETGMDGWADGGTDCYRYQGALSPEGSYAIRLRDNSDSESAMTSAFYNLSAYNTVKIEFKFRANGMENGEDFWFRYYNGSSWSTVNTFVAGTNFVNNQLYTITVTLTGQFPTNAQFRFQCDASENDDEVFIDAVIISANKGSSLIDGPFTIQSENNVVYEEKLSSDFLLTPNPAEHFVRIKANDQIKRINVFNMAGQWLPVAVNNNAELDISGLSSGIYMVKIETEEETFTERLVKI